ncbi:hypothetical protein CH299_28960 [Rhodococcus sp. 14-2686-1-2]|nr:hypothetical protein CH301_28445 [Rhodococcus sp. 15-1189-1-1a]OZF08193.1 hypothetical protein CH299_28960 [Rhodococcus sp. 14-2686-1-2]
MRRPDARRPIPLELASRGDATVPLACALPVAGQGERIELWASILARATGRRRVDGGLEFEFPPGPGFVVRLTEAIAAELVCCSFYVFSVSFGAARTVMVVRAPGHGVEVVAELFGPLGGG